MKQIKNTKQLLNIAETNKWIINNPLDKFRCGSEEPEILTLELSADAHDRFLIIDNTKLYHIGASIKELVKKWFAFSKMDIEVGRMLHILKVM